jgi:large subunit ribosomal protein L14
MTQLQSQYKVADNSGAKQVMHIRTVRGGKHDAATLGDVVVVTVKRAIPHGTVGKKSVLKGVIVRTTKPHRRSDGSVIRFDDNAVVLINNDNRPIGTRVFGPIAREIRDSGFREIVSLAPEVL